MIRRKDLTLQTKETLLLGIASDGKRCAVTGSLRLITGELETDVIAMVDDGLFATLCAALDDLRLSRVPNLIMVTNSQELMKFLTPPIFVQPTTQTTVWRGREKSVVPTGGDPHQWRLLRLLFP